MPGTNVVVPTQWKNKLVCSDRIQIERGTATFPVKANIALPDGTPVNIATSGVVAEVSSSLLMNGLTLGDVVGGATDGAQTADILPVEIYDRFYARLVEAIPSTWYGLVVGLYKGANDAGYTLISGSGWITGTNVFKVISLKDGVVGQTNCIVEIEKTS